MSDNEQSNNAELKAGALLVAKPGPYMNADPTFSEAVILLLDHSETGSIGVIINKPYVDIPYEVVVQSIGMDVLKNSPEKMMFSGGPMQEGMYPLSVHNDDSKQIGDSDIGLVSKHPEELDELPSKLKLCMGYAGWRPGAIEDEMAMMDSWAIIDSDADIVFAPFEEIYQIAAQKACITAAENKPKPDAPSPM